MVSIAAINRKTKNSGIVGLVFTPGEYRGKGYATSLVHINPSLSLQTLVSNDVKV